MFTAVSLRIDAKVRRVSNLVELTKQHREIWTQIYRRPELKRILESEPDLEAKPVTEEERLFITLLILHLASAYEAIRAGVFKEPERLQVDVRKFFSNPVPRMVWRSVRPLQNRSFISFLEQCLGAKGSSLAGLVGEVIQRDGIAHVGRLPIQLQTEYHRRFECVCDAVEDGESDRADEEPEQQWSERLEKRPA